MDGTFWLKSTDQTDIYVKKWANETNHPKAIVQLSHGMVEHIERYTPFAEFLLSHNIFVFGNDHRGHGETGVEQGLLGYFSDADGFEKTKEDLYTVTKHIQHEYPDTPLLLFGHSMGSFLARRYIQTYSHEINGLILSGTGYFSSPEIKLGKALANRLPPKEKSHLMNYLTIGNNNRAIKHKKSAFDWLTRDADAIQSYIEDPLSGFVPTARFFYDLMSGLEMIHSSQLNNGIRTDLPILLMSGDEDPVGKYGRGVLKTAHLLEDAGIESVMTMLFEHGRHEMLNEINNKEVFQFIYKWISQHL